MTPHVALAAALTALDGDDLAEAVRHLIAAWRVARAPRIAELVDAAHRRMQAALAPRDPVGEAGTRTAHAAWLEVARTLAETGDGKQRSGAIDRFRFESKDVDLDVVEVTGTVQGVDGVLPLQVDPAARPELKPKADPTPVPPVKK